MGPFHIAFVIARADAFGGSSRHVIDMAARLRRDGHRATVLIGGDPSMVVPRRLAERGVPFVCVPSLEREIRPWKDLRALRALRRELKKLRPDLISTHASKGGVLGRLAGLGLGVPVFYTPHCWSFIDGFPGARKFRWIERLMAKLSTRIIAVSEAERELGLRNKVGRADRTVTIHNGLGEIPETAPAPAAGDTARIVMVGRFEEQKDHRLLLDALAELRDLDWRLTLVGDGPKKEECAAYTEKRGLAGKVSFPGYVSAVEDGLSAHNIFALVTNWEGFPRSILEAMRNGLPVISSDVGGCRESVLDGVNGRIVARGDRRGLVEALRELITSPERRAEMGRAGFELYRERFNFEAMYQEYLKLYASLLPAGRLDPAALEVRPAPTALRP